MKIKSINILGIPVQNLTLRIASEQILQRIYSHEKGKPPSYISTLNADFIANVHSWGFIEPQHPELLRIIRDSSLTTSDGFPIVLLSHLLRCPLRGRVIEADLVPELLELLNVKNKSVYILGGEESTTRLASQKLLKGFEGLHIKGIDCPMIYVEGSNLIDSPERDSLILERINKAQPDVLLLCLGSPKQEVWFERVRHQLEVPVVVGIGETLDFISGKTLRAPQEVQRIGLEWLWRLVQDPRRLFGRYIKDFIKLIWLGVPLILYHNLNDILTYFFRRDDKLKHSHQSLLFISTHHSICSIAFPKTLDGEAIEVLEKEVKDAYNREAIILDMRQTLHMDLEGIAFLIRTRIKAQKDNRSIYMLGIRWNVKLLLIVNKAWDLLRIGHFSTPRAILYQINTKELYEAIDQKGFTVRLAFFGRLGQQIDYEQNFHKLAPMLQQKNCLLDFNYCTGVDNTAVEFLLKIRQMMKDQKTHLSVTGLSKKVKNELKAAKVYGIME